MALSRPLRTSALLVIAVLTLLAINVPASSADDSWVFPPDMVCPGFGVQWDTHLDVDLYREIAPRRGDVVHGIYVQAGLVTLTNLSTNKQVSEYVDGAVFHDRYYPDGTALSTLSGEFIVSLYPTDTPAGPSLRLYNGRMTYRTDVDGNWTVESVRGTSVDLCARLTD